MSVMAGVPASTLHRAFGGGCRVVRTMPNTCLLRQGLPASRRGQGPLQKTSRTSPKCFGNLGAWSKSMSRCWTRLPQYLDRGRLGSFALSKRRRKPRSIWACRPGGCGHPRSINGRGAGQMMQGEDARPPCGNG